MSNNRAKFIIDQGAEFLATLTWYTNQAKTTTKDLTGFTAEMQIRKSLSSDPIITLSTANGRITFGTPLTDGVINLQVAEADTAALIPDNYIFDLKMVKTGETKRLIQGVVAVDAAVTR